MVHHLNWQGILQRFDEGVDFLDPAVQFGAGGAFETLRVEAGGVHLFSAHRARLARTLDFLRLRPAFPEDRLQALMAEEIALHPPDAGLRLRLTAGLDPESPEGEESGAVRVFAEARPLAPQHLGAVHDRPPLRLHLFADYGLSAVDAWRQYKTTGYFAHREAWRRARARGFDEALFLNEFGNVVEASAHNIFWVSDSCLFSPPVDAGALPGTFAAYVRDLATRLGIEHRTANAWIGEIRQAESLFLTNAIGEIRAVSVLDELPIRPVGETAVGRRLLEGVEAERARRADLNLSGGTSSGKKNPPMGSIPP